jgi:hypothetical protein
MMRTQTHPHSSRSAPLRESLTSWVDNAKPGDTRVVDRCKDGNDQIFQTVKRLTLDLINKELIKADLKDGVMRWTKLDR